MKCVKKTKKIKVNITSEKYFYCKSFPSIILSNYTKSVKRVYCVILCKVLSMK